MKRVFKIMALALLSSCVAEDLTNCPPPPGETALRVSFGAGQMDALPGPGDLHTASVWVFDAAGKQVASWTMADPELDRTYDTGIVLNPGAGYRVVSWINAAAPYTATTGERLADGRVALTVPADGNVTGLLPMLLYASADVEAGSGDRVLPLPMVQDTYRLNVTLHGVRQDGSTYRLQIADTNGAYDFNNNFVDTPPFNYIDSAPAGGAPGGTATGDVPLSLRTLRLDHSRSPMISIVNTTTGQTVFPQNGAGAVNLMELIRQTGIDIGRTHNLNIDVPPPPTDIAEAAITVFINGWRVVMDDKNMNPYE